jgi:WhiB family redox-sensing transcriptional regulator
MTAILDDQWAAKAACRGEDPTLFDTEPVLRSPALRTARDTAAKAICHGCPVKDACLAHALFYREEDGVWGEMNPAERLTIQRRRAAYGR